jgi:hypothetical protein
LDFLYVRYSSLLHLPPSDSTVSEDAGIETRTVTTRSHPQSARSHPQSARSHPQSDKSHPQSAKSHPQSARFHPSIDT